MTSPSDRRTRVPRKADDDACGMCGRDPAAGWAKVGDVRYCHDDRAVDCYLLAQTPPMGTSEFLHLLEDYEAERQDVIPVPDQEATDA